MTLSTTNGDYQAYQLLLSEHDWSLCGHAPSADLKLDAYAPWARTMLACLGVQTDNVTEYAFVAAKLGTISHKTKCMMVLDYSDRKVVDHISQSLGPPGSIRDSIAALIALP